MLTILIPTPMCRSSFWNHARSPVGLGSGSCPALANKSQISNAKERASSSFTLKETTTSPLEASFNFLINVLFCSVVICRGRRAPVASKVCALIRGSRLRRSLLSNALLSQELKPCQQNSTMTTCDIFFGICDWLLMSLATLLAEVNYHLHSRFSL